MQHFDNITVFFEESKLLSIFYSLVDESNAKLKFHEVDLLAPITAPDKVLCIGMNYKDHALHHNKQVPKEPVVFNKFPSCIIGPSEDVPYPEITTELDYEVELAIVIGKPGFHIPESRAKEFIFGFTVAQDVSARDWQMHRNGGQVLLGKKAQFFQILILNQNLSYFQENP